MRRLLAHYLPEGSYRFEKRGLASAFTMQATTMGQNLLQELQITADSEGGGVWTSASGIVTASNFSWFQDKIDDAIVEGFDWTVGGSAPIKVWSSGDEWAIIRVINEAHYARVGGTEQVRTNDESISKYKRRTHTRLDLHNDSDTDVGVLAERLVQFAGVDRLRITDLTFLPEPGSDAAEMAATARMGDTLLATVNTLFGWSYPAPTQVFGIEHDVTPDRWLCTLRVDDTFFAGEYFEYSRDEFAYEEFR